MRGQRAKLAAAGTVAALCALVIAVVPQHGAPQHDALHRWQHTPQVEDTYPAGEHHIRRIFGGRTDESRIANIGSPQPTHSALPVQGTSDALSQTPIIRIETEQHVGAIRNIDVDARRQLLVTGAFDKTARVWAIPQAAGEQFRLLKVLRTPVQNGRLGQVIGVAISPDGRTVAVGGITGVDQARGISSIYIFDWRSGRVVRRLEIPSSTPIMAFSPNGERLAVGLHGAHGVRVFSIADWSPIDLVSDLPYANDVYGLSFAPDGRLVVASWDGAVRIYSSKLKLLAASKALDGDRLFRVAISKDNKIAVTSYDRPLVAVLSGKDLSELHRLEAPYSEPSYAVTWSGDGKTLYSGGHGQDPSGRRVLRSYAGGDFKSIADWPVSGSTIQASFLAPGGVLFAAQDPTFGLIDFDGKIIARVDPQILDARRADISKKNPGWEALLVSDEATSVSLPFEGAGKTLDVLIKSRHPSGAPKEISVGPRQQFGSRDYWRYHNGERSLQAVDLVPLDLNPARIASPTVKVDVTDPYDPKFQGKSIANREAMRQRGDKIESFAIAHDDSVVLWGSDYWLAAMPVDLKGGWAQSAPGFAWQVNISRDGRLAVAAYGDGTVRWHDMRDGRELLALFVTRERKNPRWVAWTPAGYYDASPGAEDLIGWHVNQGMDKEALFFSASRFRDLYYRPDIIKSVLKTLEVAEPPSREEILAAAPPVVTILGQRTLANGDVVVDYEASTIFGDPVEIDVFVDNAKVDNEGARAATPGNERQTVTVPKGSCADTIAIVARDAEGRASDAALVARQTRIGASCRPDTAAKPKLFALLVGVSDYQERGINLKFAHQDALDFAASLQDQKGAAYSDVVITTLTNEQATTAAIESALKLLLENDGVGQTDVTMLFFAGHGIKLTRESGSEHVAELYLVTHDTKINRLASTAVSASRVVDAVRNRLGRKFVFLDACFSSFGEQSGLGLFDVQGIANILGGSDVRAEVFSSSTGDQVSFEKEQWRNGAFTEAVVAGLKGEADFVADGRITNGELNLFVKKKVSELTEARQTPTYTAAGSVEFTLATTRPQ